jgi:hypothetical protein
MLNDKPPQNYDGFYFLPGRTDIESFSLAFFNLKGEFENGKPVNGTDLGDMYHVAFFKRDANGNPAFDDAFEAIFRDPTVYVEGLEGAEIYGCIVRKTDKSEKWFAEYLEKTKGALMLKKLINVAKSIAETK